MNIFSKAREKLSDSSKKTLVENWFYLSLLQVANYILPLLTIPYLVRILQPEKFGLVAFAAALAGYFGIIIDYGFNLSAPKKIAVNKENNEILSSIFSSVIVIKTILFILCSLIVAFLIVLIPGLREEWAVYVFSYGLVIGNIIFPTWFFQGVEKMKYIAFLNFLMRLIYTVSVFVFIRKQSDYILVPLLNTIGMAAAGIISLWIIYVHFKIVFKVPDRNSLLEEINEGWHLFISNLSISLYTTSNAFILGLFAGNASVGYFSAVEKIINPVKALYAPITQSVYPYISRLVQESRDSAINFLRKVIFIVGIFSLLISVVLFVFAKEIVLIVLGASYEPSIIVLQVMSFLPFIVGLSNVFGIQTMLPFNLKKEFSGILITAGTMNIVLAVFLAIKYQYVGVSIAVLVTELLIAVAMYLVLQKNGINLFLRIKR